MRARLLLPLLAATLPPAAPRLASAQRPGADTGDHLHPNKRGHRMIAEAFDLALFAR